MSTTVWTTGGRNTRVHLVQDCRGIRLGQASGGTPLPVREVPLDDVHHPLLCRWCFPKAKRLKVWHPICSVCKHNKPRPCPHNGAVLVWQPRRGQWTGRWGLSSFDPDLVTYQQRWVWPENAHKYTLVDPAR